MKTAEVYIIDDLVLDPAERRLTRHDQPLKLGGLTFDLLVALVQSAPGLATYDEISEKVWQGRPVTPETMAQRAKMLREALADSAKHPRYFELVRGQGYRLIAPVEPKPVGPKLVEPSASTRPKWLKALSITGLVILAIAATVMLVYDQPPPRSIAVLPFKDLTPTGDHQYLADGLAAELINQLSQLNGLTVASRTQSFYFREPTVDLSTIGQQLDVASLLEGSVQKSGDIIRVAVQLIDVETGYELWSANFERQQSDLILMQTDIASSLAGALGVKLGTESVNEFLGAGTKNVAAYDAYLRGNYEQAIALDPDYAAAWGRRGIEIASTMRANPPEDAPEIIAKARQYVTRATELQPNSAEALSDLATQTYVTFDWVIAHQTYERALNIKASPFILSSYGNMLMRTGRSSAAHEVYQQAARLQRSATPVRNHSLKVDLALAKVADVKEKISRLSPEQQNVENWLLAINYGSAEEVRRAMMKMPNQGQIYAEFFAPLLQRFHEPEAALA